MARNVRAVLPLWCIS